jgi:hypothetical protein
VDGERLTTLPQVGVSKKIKKPIKPRKLEKNNRKNQTVKKKPIKPIRILKKPTGSVQFQFYKPETEKIELNPNRKKNEPSRKKPSQTEKTEPNQFEPVFVLKKPNRTETGRFEPVSVFFKIGLVTFLG